MVCDKCKKKIDTYPCYICGYEGKESEKQVSSFSFTDIIDQVFHPPYQDDSKKELLIIFLSCVIGFIIFLTNLLFFKGKNLTLMASYGINPYVQLLVAIVFGTFFYYHRKVSCLTSFVTCVVISAFNFFITALMLFRATYSFVYLILIYYLFMKVFFTFFMKKISSYWLIPTIFVYYAINYFLISLTLILLYC